MTRMFNWRLVFKTMGVLTTLEALFMLVSAHFRCVLVRRTGLRRMGGVERHHMAQQLVDASCRP